MSDFRRVSPRRKVAPPKVSKYQEYKDSLREDFHQRCGYCGDHDFFQDTRYEIDHFVPKCIDSSREKDYSNLVYSCSRCNNSKRAQWPTNDKDKPNDGCVGWVDPCDPSYSDNFERLSDGSIKSATQLGDWMWTALSLGNPTHRLVWVLEEIHKELEQATSLEITNPDELQSIQKLAKRYLNFMKNLRGTPNFK